MMIDEFVDIAESELEISAGSEDDVRESDQNFGDVSFESSSSFGEDSPVPVETVPASPETPVSDVSLQEGFSLGDILDSFGSALLAGVSSDEAVDQQLPSDSSSELVEEPDEPVVCVGVETFALSPIESSSGLKGILLDVLGPYDNVVTQYRYQQGSNQYYTYATEITPDYPWIFSAVLFIVLLLSVFRLFGRCFRWTR